MILIILSSLVKIDATTQNGSSQNINNNLKENQDYNYPIDETTNGKIELI